MGGRAHLLGVPNFSEGASERVIGALEATLARYAEVLNVHSDALHNRSVFTVAAEPAELARALLAGAEHAIALIDMRRHQGLHPHVGALDVCPAVWPLEEGREAAREVALEVAEGIGKLGIPVFLYGELAADPDRRERAHFRRGGLPELIRRMAEEGLEPDFGPGAPHPSAGATLVTARHPLVAYNLELDTPDLEVARAIAAELRESGGGPTGVRAIGLPWSEGRTQISINVTDPQEVSLARVAREAGKLARERGARVVEAELVGLAPEEALRGYQDGPPIRDFDPDTHLIERRLAELDR
jgi:glutamate formiminotransferase